ncbi:MAG: uracil-DNA glycosylase [Pseudomonadota bacterium]
MSDAPSYHALLDALAWQVELGATDAIGEVPVNRYALPDRAAPSRPPQEPAGRERSAAASPTRTPLPAAAAPPAPGEAADPIGEAQEAATAAASLDALRAALDRFPHCDLRHGATQLVFADGRSGARVMIVGEAPGRDEDLQGRPFVGRAGQLLDRMLAAIGLARDAPDLERAVYITNILPWRPPQNRDPRPEEIALMKPFLARHVALADPDILIAMGNISCQALLGRRGITRLRGGWTEALGLPCLPMFHPAYLLRTPSAKREAWADLLAVSARLEER